MRALENASAPAPEKGLRLITSGCLYYVLSDMRRVCFPVGMLTDSLRGRLCHYLASTVYTECVESVLSQFGGINKINFLPAVHAEAMYLIAPEKRDEYAVLFDFGYISSTYSVIWRQRRCLQRKFFSRRRPSCAVPHRNYGNAVRCCGGHA